MSNLGSLSRNFSLDKLLLPVAGSGSLKGKQTVKVSFGLSLIFNNVLVVGGWAEDLPEPTNKF